MRKIRRLFIILIPAVLIGLLHLYNIDLGNQSISMSDKPLIIAHRGASGLAPENTLPAIQQALDLKVDGIEIDVHLSADQEVMVMHDATLDRTTNGSGPILSHTYEDLTKLDAGSYFSSEYANTTIPSLDQVLALVDGKAILFIEVKKGAQGRYAGLEEKVIAAVNRHEAENWIRIMSFENETLEAFQRLAPNLRYQKLLVGQLPALPLYMDGAWHGKSVVKMKGVEGINPNSRFATQRFIRKVHQYGKTINVWTVDDPDQMQRLAKKGVDGIITNRPDLAQRVLLGSSKP